MLGIGCDIIEIDRIAKIAAEKLPQFLARFFSEKEIAYFNSKNNAPQTIAGNFAAKEAFSKALGTGIRGFALKDAEILRTELGQPYILFKGVRLNCNVSISHSRTHAISTVILENSCRPLFNENFNNDGFVNFDEARKILPQRAMDAHKGDCGKLLIIAGSRGLTGSAALAANAALRTGAGLVTVMCPASVQPILAIKLTEAMTYPLPENNGIICEDSVDEILTFVENADAVVFGPGVGRSLDIFEILSALLKNLKIPLLIDADGINALSDNIYMLGEKKCPVVLTPHVMEFARISGKSVDFINKNRLECAGEFADKYGVSLVLKGKNSVIADRDKLILNPTGNAGMATGGSGDVLSGIIGTFLAAGLCSFDAAKLGAFLHGLAGDIGAEYKTQTGLIAGDIIEYLPNAIRMLL